MEQLTIFPTPDTSTADKITRLLAGAEDGQRALGCKLAKQNGFELSGLLIRHIKKTHEKDFKKVWATFERNGVMVYYKSHFGKSDFCLAEYNNGQLVFAGTVLYSTVPDDKFGDKLTNKYVNLACTHIRNNSYYFNNLIEV